MFGLSLDKLILLAGAGLMFAWFAYDQWGGSLSDMVGGWFKRRPPRKTADDEFNEAIAACDVLMQSSDPQVKQLAAQVARRVVEVAYPVRGPA